MFYHSFQIRSVLITSWTDTHYSFVVETTAEYVQAIKKVFRVHFLLLQNYTVMDRKSILLWVENCRITGSLIRGRTRTSCIQWVFRLFLYRHLKLSETLENSLGYCYTSYEMTGQFLWFHLQMNSYISNWNTPYYSLIVTAGEFQKCNLDVRTL